MKKILKDGGVEIVGISAINYFPPKNEGKFGVILTDPILLYPNIDDKQLKRKEVYNIYNNLNCYEGTQKGQLILGLIFHSLEELFKVYIELKRLGYRKVKIVEDEIKSNLDQKLYNLNEIEDVIDFTKCFNSILVQIKEKELDKFKSDLLIIGQKLNYRYFWGSEDLFEGTECRTIKKKYIIY